MKTLTYGTLPSFSDFEKAFVEAFGGNGSAPDFTMNLKDSDARMFEDLNIRPYSTRYNAPGLYMLCEALVVVYDPINTEWDWSASEWAGDFCSSILSTLGFEWV